MQLSGRVAPTAVHVIYRAWLPNVTRFMLRSSVRIRRRNTGASARASVLRGSHSQPGKVNKYYQSCSGALLTLGFESGFATLRVPEPPPPDRTDAQQHHGDLSTTTPP